MIPVRKDALPRNERGIALIAAVLVVLLTTLLVATFMTTTMGERSLSSNVQTAKISLYAADAGVRTEQQVLANIAQTKIDSCVAAWNGTGAIIQSPATLFPAGINVVTATNPPFSAQGTIVWRDSTQNDTAQVYNYVFTITSQGSVGAMGMRRVQAQGLLRVSAERGSFADYLLFTNRHTMADGSAIWFTSSVNFDGRVHTNTQFRFAFKPTFSDLVTSVDPNAQYFNNGGTVKTLNANNNGTIDVPNFYGGFNRNQANVPLPTDTYNQQAVALGYSSGTGALTNAQINTKLGLSGSGTPANGVYVINSSGADAGGIYVQGDASQIKMWADTTTNRQWYQITQGGTVRTIKVDPATGKTDIWNSATTTGSPASSYNGAPNGVLYVNGQVLDLRGPDRAGSTVLPAVAENNKLLICSKGDIVVQRDVTLDSYNNNDNVLGLYSETGAVRIGSSAPNDCNLDAFVMAPDATNGQFAVDNYNSGSARGTFHLRGGMVTQYYGGFYTFNSSGVQQTGFGRDFHYDRRGLIPPCYPTTTRFNADIPSARTLAWKEI